MAIDTPSNKPLERAGIEVSRPSEHTSAGRSAASRYPRQTSDVWRRWIEHVCERSRQPSRRSYVGPGGDSAPLPNNRINLTALRAARYPER